jgi:hypothetical protein
MDGARPGGMNRIASLPQPCVTRPTKRHCTRTTPRRPTCAAAPPAPELALAPKALPADVTGAVSRAELTDWFLAAYALSERRLVAPKVERAAAALQNYDPTRSTILLEQDILPKLEVTWFKKRLLSNLDALLTLTYLAPDAGGPEPWTRLESLLPLPR